MEEAPLLLFLELLSRRVAGVDGTGGGTGGTGADSDSSELDSVSPDVDTALPTGGLVPSGARLTLDSLELFGAGSLGFTMSSVSTMKIVLILPYSSGLMRRTMGSTSAGVKLVFSFRTASTKL